MQTKLIFVLILSWIIPTSNSMAFKYFNSFLPQKDTLVFVPVFPDSSRIFLNNPNIQIPVKIKNVSDHNFAVSINYKVFSDYKELLYSGPTAIQVLKSNNDFIIKITPGTLKPGFYDCNIIISGEITKNYTFRFGVDPEKLIAVEDSVPDLEKFWERAKNELQCVDPQYIITKIDSLSDNKFNIYLVEMRSLGNVLIRGWLSEPVKEGRYPGIVMFPGFCGSFTSINMFKKEGFVCLGLNIRGLGNSTFDISACSGSKNYYSYSIHDKECYIYRGAYMDCLRGVDFLSSNAKVDPKKIIAKGFSQGGRLALTTAALDHRIWLCLSEFPGTCDYRNYHKLDSSYITYIQGFIDPAFPCTLKDVYNTLSYIDAKNLAKWINCPVLMTLGLIDDVHPPRTVFAPFNHIKSEHKFIVFPGLKHQHPSNLFQVELEWMMK